MIIIILMLIIILKTVIKLIEIIVNMTIVINRHMDSRTVGYTDIRTDKQMYRQAGRSIGR